MSEDNKNKINELIDYYRNNLNFKEDELNELYDLLVQYVTRFNDFNRLYDLLLKDDIFIYKIECEIYTSEKICNFLKFVLSKDSASNYPKEEIAKTLFDVGLILDHKAKKLTYQFVDDPIFNVISQLYLCNWETPGLSIDDCEAEIAIYVKSFILSLYTNLSLVLGNNNYNIYVINIILQQYIKDFITDRDNINNIHYHVEFNTKDYIDEALMAGYYYADSYLKKKLNIKDIK